METIKDTQNYIETIRKGWMKFKKMVVIKNGELQSKKQFLPENLGSDWKGFQNELHVLVKTQKGCIL